MTPGSPPLILPEGMAKRIPAGWRLLFVVHYSPIGTPKLIGRASAWSLPMRRRVKKEVATNVLGSTRISVFPPTLQVTGSSVLEIRGGRPAAGDVPSYALAGQVVPIRSHLSRWSQEILLDVPRYDFRWQNRYELADRGHYQPERPCDAWLTLTIRPANPANPDPSALVKAGQQSWEEMFNGYYESL